MATVRKLVVEVVDARNVQPKDGHGKSSPYVILDYHGQRQKTKTVIENLNPTWNETLKFNLVNTPTVFGDLLELKVLHNTVFGSTTRNKLLGRVSLNCGQFVKNWENLSYYPLKKKCWSYIYGEIGLKIYFVDEVVPPPPVPNPEPTPVPAPPPLEKPETPPVPPAQPAENPPPYPYSYSYPCPYSYSYPYENIYIFSLSEAEEKSYEDDSYPTLGLISILFAFQLWFFLVCLMIRC